MSTVVRFLGGRRPVKAKPIPREEFERLADMALDILDRIERLLDDEDGDPNLEDGGDAETSLGAPDGHESQVVYFRGSLRNPELDRQLEDCA